MEGPLVLADIFGDLLERLPEAQQASFVPHTEDAADLGRISLGYRDLASLRDNRSAGALLAEA